MAETEVCRVVGASQGALLEADMQMEESLPGAQCICYDPFSVQEGRCSLDYAIVPISECNNPSSCSKLIREGH